MPRSPVSSRRRDAPSPPEDRPSADDPRREQRPPFVSDSASLGFSCAAHETDDARRSLGAVTQVCQLVLLGLLLSGLVGGFLLGWILLP